MRFSAFMMLVLSAGVVVGQSQSGRTEPKVGYAAQNQNESALVGCVNANGDGLRTLPSQGGREYRLHGDQGQLKAAAGKMVRLRGQMSAEGAQPAFHVAGVEVVQDRCSYDENPVAVTGKTGNEGGARDVASTASAGSVTPPRESEAGRKQASGDQGQKQIPREKQFGAPKTAEETAQNPADAERMAQAAGRAELNNPQRQLGVNARPDYSQNRNEQKGTELPGASQHPQASGQREQKREHEAEENQKARPTLTGCLTASGGESSREFFLSEEGSGRRYRLNGTPEQLNDHLNHTVRVAGRPGGGETAGKMVAGKEESSFFVTAVQDLAPTCSGGAR